MTVLEPGSAPHAQPRPDEVAGSGPGGPGAAGEPNGSGSGQTTVSTPGTTGGAAPVGTGPQPVVPPEVPRFGAWTSRDPWTVTVPAEPVTAPPAGKAGTAAGKAGTAAAGASLRAEEPAGGPEAAPAEARATGPARLALGVAVLAAERVRGGAGGDESLAVAVGLVQAGAARTRRAVRRAAAQPAGVGERTARWAGNLPGAGLIRAPIARARRRWQRVTDDAAARGRSTVAAGRRDALAFIRTATDDGVQWAQREVVPKVVDGLVPHLVDKVVPELIDGAMPEVRDRVLPVVIEDLTNDPRVREFVMTQGRGVLDEATDHLRASTASADNRLESTVRRVLGRRSPMEAPPTPDR